MIATIPKRTLKIYYSSSGIHEIHNDEGPIDFVFYTPEECNEYNQLILFLGDVEVGSIRFKWSKQPKEFE